MIKKTKSFALIAVVATSLALLTACAAGDSNALTAIKDRQVVTIGSSGNNNPTIFKDASGEFVGVDVDWANIVAEDLGAKIEWKVLDFKGIVPGLQSGQFDLAMSGLRVTAERAEVIDFSDAYASEDAVVVYPSSMTGINSPEDITGKTVCVVAGSSNGDQPVERIGTAKESQAYPGVAEAFEGLKVGRCELLVTGRAVAKTWLKGEGEGRGFSVSTGGTDCTSIAIGVPKGEPELLKAINESIATAVAAGKYDEIAEKWIGEPFPVCDSK